MRDSENVSEREKENGRGIQAWIGELDRILRGDATRPEQMGEADIRIPVAGISALIVAMGVFYGFCMGVFSLVHGFETAEYRDALLQTLASMCKVPLLFLLTLVVTFPSLHVFNALVGSRLKMLPTLKLLVASLAVNLAVLASLGPILAFFSVSTPSYGFIVFMNVVVFAIAGFLGLTFLIQTLNRMAGSESPRRSRLPVPVPLARVGPAEQVEVVATADSPPAARGEVVNAAQQEAVTGAAQNRGEGVVLGRHVRSVFLCWIVLFGLVEAQMGWVLRPLIGTPGEPFQWFHKRESSFFQAVFEALGSFFFAG